MDTAGADHSGAEAGNQERIIQLQAEQLDYLRRGMLEMAGRQEQQLTALHKRLDLLVTEVQPSSSSQTPHPSSSSSPAPVAPFQTSPAPVVQLARPERFSGDSGDCRAFITQCELHLELHTAAFPTERSKVAFMISHLTDRAGAWATAEWQRGATTCASLPAFLEAFTQVFQHTKPGREAARALMRLRQGPWRVADYAIEFRTLGSESDWNPAALTDAFLEGLSEEMKDQLAPLEIPSSLEPLIALAIRIDNRLQDRRKGRRAEVPRFEGRSVDSSRSSHHALSAASTDLSEPLTDEPMLLGHGCLSSAERKRRITAGECLYCGQRGHFCRACPKSPLVIKCGHTDEWRSSAHHF
uniref:CCHC-type domain-containing protein n=1 Tax=Oryzias latipes TaxID=8090 RepID=A0A3P9JJ87_ORYLA